MAGNMNEAIRRIKSHIVVNKGLDPDDVAQRVLQVTAQVGTVFNPYTVSVVYLYHDAVVSGHFYVHEVVVALLQPLLNCFFNDVPVYHKVR